MPCQLGILLPLAAFYLSLISSATFLRLQIVLDYFIILEYLKLFNISLKI